MTYNVHAKFNVNLSSHTLLRAIMYVRDNNSITGNDVLGHKESWVTASSRKYILPPHEFQHPSR